MRNQEQARHLEVHTIQPIARDARHGTARDLFTVWFGSNLTLLTIVTGGLAVTVFRLPFGWAVLALTAGNLVGAIFMALHAAQGPILGVPQMLQTRGQFGSHGSLLVVGIVIVMYAGFLASNLVLGGQALANLITGLGSTLGILLVCMLSFVAAVFGHDLIHAYARTMTYVSGLVLLLTFGWILWVHGLPAHSLQRNSLSAAGVLGTISTAALWQIAYAPYVSDYSRYLPHDTGALPAFWASYWGCTLGSVLPMILGALVGLEAGSDDLIGSLAMLTRGIAPLVLVVFCIGLATANAMNLYCAALSILTFGQTLHPPWAPRATARTVCVLLLSALVFAAAVLGKHSFLENYTNFILLMLYVLVPWTAINLVDYYLLRHGAYDVASFLRRDGGIYGRINAIAVGCYFLGILVELPFVATPDYTGPIARSLHGIDLSWMVGLAITSPAYYWLARWGRPMVATLRWTSTP